MLLRNVLIFHTGALGDFLQTWPLGLALGRLYPQSRVIYITHSEKGALAEKALRLDSGDIESGWHHLFGDPAKLHEICRKKLTAAHSIFTFIATPGDPWMKSVAAIAPAAKLIAISPGPWHQIRQSLSALPIVHAAISQIESSITTRGIGTIKPIETGPIAIHPGSGSPDKCWPIDFYLSLIEQLQSSGHSCRIFLGEVERHRWSPEEIRRLQSAAETIQPGTYVDLFGELARCSAFIGNDSGPGHLAAMMGLNTMILFGPTDPAVWKPLGPRVHVVRVQPLASLASDRVYSEFQGFLSPSVSSALE
jgi:heptosyltransferase III